MRLDRFDDALHTLHDVGKVELRTGGLETQLFGAANLRQKPRRANQCLGRHATQVQTFAAHLILLDQRDLGLDCRGDIRRHQAGGSGTDDDDIAVETFRFRKIAQHLLCFHEPHHLLGNKREKTDECKRDDQAR